MTSEFPIFSEKASPKIGLRALAMFVGVIALMTIGQALALRHIGHAGFTRPAIVNLAIGLNILMALFGIVLVSHLYLKYKNNPPSVDLFRQGIRSAAAVFLLVLLIHINLAGSHSSMLVMIIPATAILLLHALGPATGWLFFLGGTVMFYFMTGLEAAGILPYATILADGESLRPIFLSRAYIVGFFSIYFSISTIILILVHLFDRDLKKRKEELETAYRSLRKATDQVRKLEGLLPFCSHCKKIRDPEGSWLDVDHYIQQHSEASVSHSICPDCMQKEYPDIARHISERDKKS